MFHRAHTPAQQTYDVPTDPRVAEDAHPGMDSLRRFKQFASLSEETLTEIARHSAIREFPAEERLAQIGTSSQYAVYLITGRLTIESGNGARRSLEGGSNEAGYAVSLLQPHRYNVTTTSPVQVLCVDRDVLQRCLNEQSSSAYVVEEVDAGAELRENLLFRELYVGCQDDKLQLPSLPEIAVRYRGNDPVHTTSDALVRLGWSTTRELVTGFAMRELFNTKSSTLKRHMQKLWRHSVDIAATCFAIAGKIKDFEPETALLAGLLQNVGAIAVIAHAEKYPEIVQRPGELERIIVKLHAHVGSMMLRCWGFPDEVSLVPLSATDYYRSPTTAPDYCGLVLFANLLIRIRNDSNPDIPPLHELPSLAALGLGDLSVDSARRLAENTKQQVEKMRHLLSAG